MNATEAAAFLGVGERQVYRLAGEGKLRGQKVGKMWEFAPADLRAYRAQDNGNGKLDLPEGEEMLALYHRLGSAKKIGEIYGCSSYAVLQRLPPIGRGCSPNNRKAKQQASSSGNGRWKVPSGRAWIATRTNLLAHGLDLAPEECCPENCPWGPGGSKGEVNCLMVEGCPLEKMLEEENDA